MPRDRFIYLLVEFREREMVLFALGPPSPGLLKFAKPCLHMGCLGAWFMAVPLSLLVGGGVIDCTRWVRILRL